MAVLAELALLSTAHTDFKLEVLFNLLQDCSLMNCFSGAKRWIQASAVDDVQAKLDAGEP